MPPLRSTKPQPVRQAVSNVLVVCHGNICRSPLAWVVLVGELGAKHVRSAACKPYYGKKTPPPAAKKIRDYATLHGYDLGQHRAKSVTPSDLLWADVVVYMDGGNLTRLKLIPGFVGTNAKCLGEWVGLPRIPDPNFIPRGEKLNKVLDDVVLAAKRCAEWVKRKPPDEARGL